MELLLWRWSTSAQITSELLIAVFFVVLARSVRRVEMRPWVQAWLSNLAALIVTSIFWLVQPSSRTAFIAIRAGYLFWKTLFLALLVVGAWGFTRRRSRAIVGRLALAAVIVYSLIAAFVLDTIDKLGMVQSAVIGLVLGVCAVFLLVKRVPGAGWLAAGLSIRTILAAIETIAHGTRVFPTDALPKPAIGLVLASYSSFDTGAEWVIALGCVLIVYRTIQQELTRSNLDLAAAQEVLQGLVDLDPLTGLSNRRALPEVFRQVFDTGAAVLFFDLNDFKGINDSYGHQIGDDCLKRFARVLQASFRPEDHVIRYAGDEFVVIASSSGPSQMLDRVERMRERLKFERGEVPNIRFAVGHAYLSPRGDAEEALRMADEAMYLEKSGSRGQLRSV
jgi:diguanylate cyclase (GGDEF)-like protein